MTISKDDFRGLVAEYIASPDNWPAAMGARTLRIAAGHPAYSPNNQTLILVQLVQRFVDAGLELEAALQRALVECDSEIAPASVWAKRGFKPEGQPLFIWSKPIPLWVDEHGQRVAPGTPGATKRTVWRSEKTYLAGDVRNVDGETGEVAIVAPEMTAGDALETFERLRAWITGQGWTVTRLSNDMRANGWTRHATRTIAVHAGLDGWEAVETLAHEIAHALLHGEGETRTYAGEHRGAMEAEAHSVAIGIMHMVGQAERVRGGIKYVTEWAQRDAKVLAAAYERACYVTDALAQVVLGVDDVEVAKSAKAEKLQAKSSNRELAAKLREAGIEPKGEAWKRAKAGEPIEALQREFAKAA